MKYDVALIGGGITGLMAAQKISALGLRVALIEKHQALASGPSTRNEGWLHRGTYHSSSIRDRATAIQVARRCIYGHEQLKHFAPEAIENPDVLPLALVQLQDKLPEVISRWEEANVRFRQLSTSEGRALVPNASLEKCAGIFQVDDVSINTRILYKKLAVAAKKFGCDFYIGHDITSIVDQTIFARDESGNAKQIDAIKIIYSTGVGAKELFRSFHKIDLPIRYWKSHLVITKRLAQAGIFYLDPHEAAMMHHGDVSIVGFNEDALLCDDPTYDTIKDRVENIKQGIKRIFPAWNSDHTMSVACVKVDFAVDAKSARSLSIQMNEPIAGHVVVLPGKMTEAPYLTDVLTSYVHEELDSSDISLRPCDNFLKQCALAEVVE